MKEIAISKFKATCLAVIEEVRVSGEPIRITKFGKPMAEVGPPQLRAEAEISLGSLRDTVIHLGDVVSPVSGESDWEANRT